MGKMKIGRDRKQCFLGTGKEFNFILFYLLELATTWPLAYLLIIVLLIIHKLIDNG